MLFEGARIAVVAPSGIFDPTRLAAGMALVESWGFELIEGDNLHARHRYTAGTIAQRRADLIWALTDDDIDAVWFARGGYGTARLLADVPWSESDGRPVIGFSDATALLCAMQRLGVDGGVHGPVLQSLADQVDDDTRKATRALLLEGGTQRLPGRHLCGSRHSVSGRVIGGNLCGLASLAGTPWAMQSAGAIVVLEDLAEPVYKIDRMLSQLIDSGAFSGVVGVALGEFVRCPVPAQASWDLEAVLRDLLTPLGVPVITGLPVGHGQRNRPWRCGASGLLTVEGLRVG